LYSFVPCVDERELRVVVDYAMFGQTAANDIYPHVLWYIPMFLGQTGYDVPILSTAPMIWCCLMSFDNIGDLHKCHDLPSGKRLHNHGIITMFHGKIHYFYGHVQ